MPPPVAPLEVVPVHGAAKVLVLHEALHAHRGLAVRREDLPRSRDSEGTGDSRLYGWDGP